jgi:alpha-aminoadipate carrier protein LysW
MSVLCPECESVVVVDPAVVEEGDTVECEECGAELEIVSLEPLKVVLLDGSGYDDPEELSFGEEED